MAIKSSKPRKCTICKCKIKVKLERYGHHRAIGPSGGFDCITSEEGVFFIPYWFCNKCWGEIINDIFSNKSK